METALSALRARWPASPRPSSWSPPLPWCPGRCSELSRDWTEQMHSVGMTDVSRPAHTAPHSVRLPHPQEGGSLLCAAAASRTAVAAGCCSGVCVPPRALPSWGGDPGLGSLCHLLPQHRAGLVCLTKQPVWEATKGAVLPRWGHRPLGAKKMGFKVGGKKEPSAQLRKGGSHVSQVWTQAGAVSSSLPQRSPSEPSWEH